MQEPVEKYEEWHRLQDVSRDYKKKIFTAFDGSYRIHIFIWLFIGLIIFPAIIYYSANLILAAGISIYILVLLSVIYEHFENAYDLNGVENLLAKKEKIHEKMKLLPQPVDDDTSVFIQLTHQSMADFHLNNGNLHQIRRRRISSFIVDLLVIFAVSVALSTIPVLIEVRTSVQDIQFFERFFSTTNKARISEIAAWVMLLYPWYFFSNSKQATIGMRLFSIKRAPFHGIGKMPALQPNYSPNSLLYSMAPFTYTVVIVSALMIAFPFYLSFFFSKYKRLPHDFYNRSIIVRSDIKFAPTEISPSK